MIKLITLITKFIIATLVALLFSSCNYSGNYGSRIKGSGHTTTESRHVNQDFNSIEVKSGISVIVEQSATKSISVNADDNLQQYVSCKIENGVLSINVDKSYSTISSIEVTVKTPEINGLNASSGSRIESKGVLITENINVKSNSGSKIDIQVEADAITLDSSSGSKIEAEGKALKLETSSSSGSSIDASDLMTNEVIAQTSSGSSTSVYPIIKLEAKASSGSRISYHKIPQSISKTENSGGSVGEK